MKKTFISIVILLIAVLSFQTLLARDISGTVLYQGDASRPISKVSVVLLNLDNNSSHTYTTGSNGFYEFKNVALGNYTLTGSTTLKGGGVSYQDAFLLFLHLINYYQFSPIQELASDVDGNGRVNWSDYNLIISNLIYKTPFPVGAWVFETKSFSITNFKDGVPTNTGGTCSGDVGGTFVPTANNASAIQLTQEGIITISKEETFTTIIQTKTELRITGTGLIINYPADLLNIESIEFKGADYKYNIDGGQIRLVWGDPATAPISFNAGETFVTIHGSSTSSFVQGMSANISFDGNTSLINDRNAEVNSLNFSSPLLKYGNPSLKLSNFPNPCTTSTKLSFYSPEKGNAILEVYNLAGQMVKNISIGQITEGFHEYSFDASQLSKGYYNCKLRIQTGKTELSKSIRIVKAN